MGLLTIRSGFPIFQSSLKVRAGGMSAGFPSGAPASTHLPTAWISSLVREGSFAYSWMPIVLSTYHGGMTPARGPNPVRFLIDRAHGRTSSYVINDIGAIESGW